MICVRSFFFFSSRRRHTRCSRDWSSDVCSSDLTGLVLIVLGTGLLKPDIRAMVGSLYDQGDARRDAGFSIFYMGINVGAFLGITAAGWLAQKIDWHIGFAAAGVGMTMGLIQYVLGKRRLQPALDRLAAQ